MELTRADATEDTISYRNDCHACQGTGTDQAFGTDCSECKRDTEVERIMQERYNGVHTGSSDKAYTPGERMDGRTFGSSKPKQRSNERSNKFAGTCPKCSSTVEAEAGLLSKANGKWITTHRDGDCKAATATPAASATKEAPRSAQSNVDSAQLDLSAVPSGTYAVPGGDTRLKIQIDNVQKGKWSGWVFVKDGAEYGNSKRYGRQRPEGKYEGDIEQELQVIMADPEAAMAAYGKLVGRCGMCNRKLEDADSVARGIGPVCAQKFN